MAASIQGGEGELASQRGQGGGEQFDHEVFARGQAVKIGDPPNSAIGLGFTAYDHDLTLSWR
jgi:hypothetical protein